MGRSCSTNGEKRNAYKILLGMPAGKRPLRRVKRRWLDNIKIDIREIVWGGMDWIDLAQDRDQWRALVITVVNLWVLKKGLAPCSYVDKWDKKAENDSCVFIEI
jgi:hypothetical protein